MKTTVKELLCEQVEDALELQRDAMAMQKLAQRQIYTAQRLTRTIKTFCPEVFNLPVSSITDPLPEAPRA